MNDKEKVQQILTKYTISELVEYHIKAVDRINKAIEYHIEAVDRICKAIEYIEANMKEEYIHTDYIHKMIKILRGE